MKQKLFSLKALVSCLLLGSVSTVSGQWSSSGPHGGPATALTVSGTNVFAGTGNGVFKSTDNGQTWTSANSTIEHKMVTALTSDASGIYAGTASHGIFFSSNSGSSWTPKNNGLSNMNIVSLFTADNGIFAGTPDGVFFTSDGGTNWMLRNSGITPSYTINSFAQMGDTIYGGSYGLGLYMTDNSGTSWTNVSSVPSGIFVYNVIAVGNTLVAGTSNGVYRSADRGLSWNLSNTGFPSGMWAKSFAATPGHLIAGTYSEGLFVSTDDGQTWTAHSNGVPDLPFPTGLPHNYPSTEAIITSGPNVIAATVNGVYASSDNGNTWTEKISGIMGNEIFGVAANGAFVYAGGARTGAYVSSNSGSSWSRPNTGLTSYDVLDVATKNTMAFVSTLNQGVFRSTDNGNTWSLANTGLTSNVKAIEPDSLRLLALTTGASGTPSGLFQSLDNGTTWTEITTPLVGYSAVESSGTDFYVAGFGGEIVYSNNAGTTWSDISSNLPAETITALLKQGGSIFAGTFSMGVYRSDNNGGSWTAVNSGISNLNIMDLYYSSGKVYVATWGGGIFSSSDNGNTWTADNGGLNDYYVRNLASNGANLYAATASGVYQRAMSVHINEAVNNDAGIPVYPNPSTGSFQLQATGQVSVYNSAGILVYTEYQEGNKLIDLSTKAKGIYVIVLQSNNVISKRKIILE
jgi:photosystem II stability/assembly factor-like uncharacterized protein